MAWGQALAPYRDREPVVISGSLLADWLGVADINRIVLYAYDSDGTPSGPILFQIDKHRKINMRWNLNDPTHTTNDCELGYFRELHLPPEEPDTFYSDLLQSTDEIVFMLKDAGDRTINTSEDWLQGAVQTKRYQITLKDERTYAYRYVYAYQWNSTQDDRSQVKYAKYTPDTPPPGTH